MRPKCCYYFLLLLFPFAHTRTYLFIVFTATRTQLSVHGNAKVAILRRHTHIHRPTLLQYILNKTLCYWHESLRRAVRKLFKAKLFYLTFLWKRVYKFPSHGCVCALWHCKKQQPASKWNCRAARLLIIHNNRCMCVCVYL